MPIIFFKEDSENTLKLEPYYSFNKKFDDKKEDGIDGARIKVDIANHKSGFVNGFDQNQNYGADFVLRFSFTKNKQDEQELFLIHHTVEYEFDEYFYDIQQDSLEELRKRSNYFFIDGAEYFEFSYHISARKAELRFDVLVSEEKIQNVCNQLISHDIAIFSRGW